jgi:hypothetical protein
MEAMGIRKEVLCTFFDISKAFDKVFKIRQMEITGKMLRLLENDLVDREQRVVINGVGMSFQQEFRKGLS